MTVGEVSDSWKNAIPCGNGKWSKGLKDAVLTEKKPNVSEAQGP